MKPIQKQASALKQLSLNPNEHKERRERRNERIEEFFEEVDSGLIDVYEKEESFQEYLSSVRESAKVIQKHLVMEGDDKLTYKVYCPFKYFCVLVSQVGFDRKTEISFRYSL